MFIPLDAPIWVIILRVTLVYIAHAVTLSNFSPSRFSPKKTFCLWLILIEICTILSILASITDIKQFAELIFTSTFIAYIIFYFWISKGSFAFKTFIYATYIYIFCAFSFIPTTISKIFFENSYIVYMCIRYAICYAGFNIIYYFFARKKFLNMVEQLNHGFGIAAIVPILFSFTFFHNHIYPYLRTFEYKVETIPVLLDFAIMLATYFLIFKFISLVVAETEIKQIKMQNDFLSQQITNYDQQNEILKRVRHDFRHHNNVLLEYAQNNQTDKIINHLKQGNEIIEKVLQSPFSNNPLINAIVSSYAHKANEKNIKTTFNINVPNEIPIDDIDLVAIIANIMENAINSASQAEIDNPFMNLNIKTKDNKLILSCENSCLDNIKFNGDLPKNKAGNGIGIHSINKSAEKYQGITNFKTDGKIFTTQIVLHL